MNRGTQPAGREKAVRVLLVEDVATDAELELRELRRAGFRLEHRIVDTEDALRRELRVFGADIILSDFSMPHFDGMFALAVAREVAPETPFIFVSGTIGEEYAIRALQSGAVDYVLKGNLVRLPAAVERALQDAAARAAKRETERELEAAHERLASIFDSVPDMLWSVGVPGQELLYASAAATRIYGHAPEVFIADPGLWLKVIHPEDRPGVDAAWLGAQAGEAFDIEYRIRRPDGSERWIHDRGRLLRDRDGRPLRIDGIARDISETKEKQRQIDFLAFYDALTGLPNRTLFQDRLTHAIDAARRGESRLALVVFDIERFKGINDTFGQPAGDRVLQMLAQRLADAIPHGAAAARLGGDQFAVLFPAIREAADLAGTLTDTAMRFFREPFVVGDKELRLAAKAGVAVYPEDGGEADALFRNAEAALKRAKATGERFLFYAPHINARVAEQVELESKLQRALERDEFVLHYQPKVDLATRRIVGAEALIRWQEPGGGLVPPGRFIPLLEETGLILAVGRWAMDEAIRAHRDLRRRGLPAPRIAVNVSSLQMREASFVDGVREAMGGLSGADCGLDLEITESLLMNDIDGSVRKLREIRALGVSIALDDFGTGYSSLAYLSKLPIDTLKIDRGFVRGMVENPDDTSITTTIISLGQSLRMKVVAEGVEDEQQAQMLRLLRCDQMQGYLFSPPVPLEKFEALLQA
jgi:diguanylate cyclase (GGDEF)-like protein/PAS domain S-box-containing protein